MKVGCISFLVGHIFFCGIIFQSWIWTNLIWKVGYTAYPVQNGLFSPVLPFFWDACFLCICHHIIVICIWHPISSFSFCLYFCDLYLDDSYKIVFATHTRNFLVRVAKTNLLVVKDLKSSYEEYAPHVIACCNGTAKDRLVFLGPKRIHTFPDLST